MDAKNDTPTNVPTPFFFSTGVSLPGDQVSSDNLKPSYTKLGLRRTPTPTSYFYFILFYFHFKLLSTLVRHTKCCLKEPYLELKILD
jgi:hypothetical protein